MVIPLRFYTVVLFIVGLGLVLLSQGQPQGPQTDLEQVTTQPPTVLETTTVSSTTPYVWWEAENPADTNFPTQHPFAPASFGESAVLSEGDWIGADGDRPNALFLEYDVSVPEAGTYFFYSRKFWKHGPFRWRWDDQDWKAADSLVFLMDEAILRPFVVANWVPLGAVSLTAGPHRLRVELTQNQGPAAFDCFMLSQTPIQARGKLKPDQRYAAEIPGWVVFDPEADTFAASPIDLRSLNEPTAGANGWIQVEGEALVHETTGEPVRFWGVNIGPDLLALDDTHMAFMARFLAKRGVNIVRYHGTLTPRERLVLDEEKRDRLFALVSALKQEGIYTTISCYFPLWFQFSDLADSTPFGLLFFEPELQAQYRTLWQRLLTARNPYTGLTLGTDPAVAMVELVNEDSLFFWTFDPDRLPATSKETLERQFATWLQQRYGSLDAALEPWDTDDTIRPAGDRVAVLSAGAIAAQPGRRRSQDTAAFLANVQYQFFDRTTQFLKQDVGYRGLVVASNWITADGRRLGPLDKYTNTVGDVMDRHGYFGGLHEGERASYALTAGDRYQDRSALLLYNPFRDGARPLNLPIMDLRYNRKPSIISEINWTMPNRLRADFPVMAAAYGSLQATDGFFFFANNSLSWDASLQKFSIASPVILGQFPAAALIYRKGLLKPGEDIVTIERPLNDLLALEGTPAVAPQNLDALRAEDVPTTEQPTATPTDTIDPLAFFVGKVNVAVGGDRHRTDIQNLAPYHNRQHRRIRSTTNELHWDYDDGLLTLDAPQVQGAVGFLNHASPLRLGPISISTPIDYGSILLVALDDQPVNRSQNLMLQVMSAEENFGWRTETVEDENSSTKILRATGTPPLVLQQLQGEVTLHRSDGRNLLITALDANGVPINSVYTGPQWELQPDIFYYWISQRS